MNLWKCKTHVSPLANGSKWQKVVGINLELTYGDLSAVMDAIFGITFKFDFNEI
jgi:hypothetical protein